MTNNQDTITKKISNFKFQIPKLVIGHWSLVIIWSLVIGYWSFPAGAMVDVGEIGVGARTLGMGKAYVGGLDDATAIFTNPAGLALNPNLNVTSMSGNLLSEVNYVLIGGAEWAPIGKVGIGYVNASVGSIPITTITGTGSTAAVSVEGSTDYGSSIIYLSYGTKLDRLLQERGQNFYVGANLKVFTQGFSGGGSSLQGATGTGMDADLGLLWQASTWSRLGVTVANCLPFSMGGKFVWKKNNVEEGIPMALRAGGAFKVLGESGFRPSETQDLSLLLDYETGRGVNRPAVWHAGLEYWPMEILALRCGIDQKPKAAESGTGVDNNLTAGVGLRYRGFTFDFAYHQFGELSENTTYFFSLGYRGIEEAIKKFMEKKEEKKPVIPLAEVAPKPELKTFIDVPADYWARKPIEYLATLGIMGGYPDQTFRPDRSLTRAELAALLVKTKEFEVKKVTKKPFKDVGSADWSAPYVQVAVERKYVSGYPDGTFQPNQRISRAEAAVVFAKFSGLYVKPKLSEDVYPDIKKSHWAAPAIAADKEAGLFEYLSTAKFGANEFLTRAEAAEILSKVPFVKDKIKELISGEK
jgi:hypothetical protein